jgi:LytS/YehU family sensor histidine kinase
MAIFTFVEGGYNNQFKTAFYIELAFLPFRLGVIYFNYFFLLPKFFLNQQIQKYILYTITTLVIASIAQRVLMYFYLNDILFPDWNQGVFWQPYRFLQSAMIITSPMILLLGLEVMSRWISIQRRAELLERDKLKAELGYLRSQINPHFFFNTLNNLYGLALRKSDKTPEVVMKLSELMSYILYEADRDLVPLSKEMDQIDRYVSLEQMRYDNRFEVELKVEGDVEHFTIPPLLLLPFVENSFKHGVNKSSKDGWISIFVRVQNGDLNFKISNRIFSVQQDEIGHNGLGIANVKKRLNLLFPNRHSLLYEESDGVFNVELVLTNKNET